MNEWIWIKCWMKNTTCRAKHTDTHKVNTHIHSFGKNFNPTIVGPIFLLSPFHQKKTVFKYSRESPRRKLFYILCVLYDNIHLTYCTRIIMRCARTRVFCDTRNPLLPHTTPDYNSKHCTISMRYLLIQTVAYSE